MPLGTFSNGTFFKLLLIYKKIYSKIVKIKLRSKGEVDMIKLPYGISDYEELIENGYYYVDKTKYIEEIEEDVTYLMYVRPKKFGKTLFSSTLENYYDIKKADKFEKLFGNTYIGKNSTKNRNRYYILKFDFANIDTTTKETTLQGFKKVVEESIKSFIDKYNVENRMDLFIKEDDEPEMMFLKFITMFEISKPDEKIYVIIDNYDSFAKELHEGKGDLFQDLFAKKEKIRFFYEILKEGTESIIDRIFITGLTPITLDGLTSGFNISYDITQNRRYNEMMGFTNEELIQMMEDIGIDKKEQEELLSIMKENYGGYRFSKDATEKICNSNMCLYFLKDYVQFGEIPEQLIDTNIASDYDKLGHMLDLCKGEKRARIIEETIAGRGIVRDITEKFNPELEFEEKHLISVLFYLGYLTIVGEKLWIPILKVPNSVMQKMWQESK